MYTLTWPRLVEKLHLGDGSTPIISVVRRPVPTPGTRIWHQNTLMGEYMDYMDELMKRTWLIHGQTTNTLSRVNSDMTKNTSTVCIGPRGFSIDEPNVAKAGLLERLEGA